MLRVTADWTTNQMKASISKLRMTLRFLHRLLPSLSAHLGPLHDKALKYICQPPLTRTMHFFYFILQEPPDSPTSFILPSHKLTSFHMTHTCGHSLYACLYSFPALKRVRLTQFLLSLSYFLAVHTQQEIQPE